MKGREVLALRGHVPSVNAHTWLMQHILDVAEHREIEAGRLAWSSEPTYVLQATAAKGLSDTALDSLEIFPKIEVVADPDGNVHDMVAIAAKEGAHKREAIFVIGGLIKVDFLPTELEDAQTVEIGSGQGLAFVVAEINQIRIASDQGNSHALYVAATV